VAEPRRGTFTAAVRMHEPHLATSGAVPRRLASPVGERHTEVQEPPSSSEAWQAAMATRDSHATAAVIAAEPAAEPVAKPRRGTFTAAMRMPERHPATSGVVPRRPASPAGERHTEAQEPHSSSEAWQAAMATRDSAATAAVISAEPAAEPVAEPRRGTFTAAVPMLERHPATSGAVPRRPASPAGERHTEAQEPPSSSEAWQAAMATRVAGLETQLATMSADIKIQQWAIDDLFSRAETPRLNGADVGDSSDPVSLAIRIAGHEASLRRGDKALEDLQSHVHLLQDCLVQLDLLPSWCLHRQRFRAVCQASKWCPSASAADALKQESALLLVCGFAEPADAAALQLVSTAARCSSVYQKVQAPRILQSACAKAETEPAHLANWSALRSVIEAAKAANVDDKQIQAAEQLCVTGHVKAVCLGSASREELSASLSVAREAGLPQEEITAMQAAAESRIGERERIAEQCRRLRIALSWASTATLPKLRKAIAEAEEAGVDAEEIAKAQCEVSRLESVESGLGDLLHVAKPAWDAKATSTALQKLACVGIVNIRQLESALDTDSADNSLNGLLKNAGQKTFTEDTCKSLRLALGTASPTSTSAAPPPSAAPGATATGGSARWRPSKTMPPSSRRGASTTT